MPATSIVSDAFLPTFRQDQIARPSTSEVTHLHGGVEGSISGGRNNSNAITNVSQSVGDIYGNVNIYNSRRNRVDHQQEPALHIPVALPRRRGAAHTYSRILLNQDYGYPLWRPNPGQSPPEHQRQGVNVGDVGKVLFNGRFVFLFNIFLNHNDSGNDFHIPGLVPMTQPHVDTEPDEHPPGEVIRSNGIINLSPETQNQNPRIEQCSFAFSCPPPEGAILVLPHGGSRSDLVPRTAIEPYIKQNVSEWYAEMKESEDLIIVTGVNKCSSWGTACYSDVSDTTNMPLSFVSGNGGNTWSSRHSIWTLTGHCSGPNKNQCIFIRGYKTKLRKSLYEKILSGSVSISDVHPANNHSPESHVSAELSLTAWLMSGLLRSNTNTTDNLHSDALADTTLVENFNMPDEPFHPSDLINAYLLATNPEAQIAITHDDVWCNVMKKSKSDSVNVLEILRQVIQTYRVVTENGCVSLTDNSGLKKHSPGLELPHLQGQGPWGVQGGDQYHTGQVMAPFVAMGGTKHTFNIHEHHHYHQDCKPHPPDSGIIEATSSPITPVKSVASSSECHEERRSTNLEVNRDQSKRRFWKKRPWSTDGTQATRTTLPQLVRSRTAIHTRNPSQNDPIIQVPISEHNDQPTSPPMSRTQFDSSRTGRPKIPGPVVNDHQSGSTSGSPDEPESSNETSEDIELTAALLERAVTDPSCVHKGKDGSIIAGTLEGLVERLIWDTTNIRQDAEYRDIFLATYAAFTNAHEVFQLLVQKYNAIKSLPMGSQARFRYNVVVLMTHWVGMPHVLVDMGVLQQMKDFAQSVANGQMAELATLVAERIDIRMSAEHSNTQSFCDKQHSASGQDFINPRDLAHAFTVLQGESYRSLFPADYIHHLLQPMSLNNIQAALKKHEHIVTWAIMSILKQEEYKGRAKTIKFLIDTARECCNLGNFASMAAIVTALQSPSISKLLMTMKVVGERGRQSLEDLSKFLGDASYNAALYKSRKSCVPLIYVHLNELRAVLRENKAVVEIDRRPLINFRRSIEITKWIKRILQYQTPKIRRIQHLKAVAYLERQLGDVLMCPSTENYVEKRSRILAKEEKGIWSRQSQLNSLGF